MIGLRVFTEPTDDNLLRDNTFYTQRNHGPIYRWHYQEEVARWRVARLHNADVHLDQLSLASWKSMPRELQTQLREHYIE